MSYLSRTVAEQLKAVRLRKGLSQGDVARRAGVERSYISSLETGKVNFSLKIVEKLLAALDVPIEAVTFTIAQIAGSAAKQRLPFVRGLLRKKLPVWKEKRWYHQRFDGCPYLLHMIAEAETWTDRDSGKKDDLSFSVHFCFFEGGGADWYILQEDIDRVARVLVERTKKNPEYVRELIGSWSTEEEAFYVMCASLEGTDLRALSDSELMQLHDRFVDIAVSRNSSSSIIDGFALGTDTLLETRLKAIYENSLLRKNVAFSEVFATLTGPTKKSFLAEAEKELFEMIVSINKDPSRKDALIRAYRDRFFWIRNNYVDSLDLPAHYFEDEVARVRSSGRDPERLSKEIDESLVRAEEKKEEYRSLLAIDKETDILIRTTELFTHWQDDRKRSTFFATHYFLLLLDEIAARTRIPSELLKYMSPRQVATVFKDPPSVSQLEQARDTSVFYWDGTGHEMVSGNEAKEVRAAIVGEHESVEIDDFRGIAASLGKVVGRVKVLSSAKEIGKIEEGDILVAVMTRPDYVPAMKKAAAIVTDEGGITSHAAIVSRELKIPCVIGTKIATRTLKDGDMVEVDANHGVVRIMRH